MNEWIGGMRTADLWSHCQQCDQIRLFLNSFANNFSFECSQNTLLHLGCFENVPY